MKEYLLPGTPPSCPNCKKNQDGAFGGNRMPQDGDYCVCIYCATISRYEVTDDTYALRVATEQDLEVARREGILAHLYATQDYAKFKIALRKICH